MLGLEKGTRKEVMQVSILILLVLLVFGFDLFGVNSFVYGYSWFHNVGGSFAQHQTSVRNGEFPLWLPNLMAGEPNWNVGSTTSNIPLLLLNYIFDPVVAFQINSILHYAFFLIGIYFLSRRVTESKNAALVSLAVVGSSRMVVYSAHFAWFMYGIAFIPWIFYFIILAVEEKRTVFCAIIAGVFAALQFIGGGVVHLYYSSFLFGLYFLYKGVACFEYKDNKIAIKRTQFWSVVVIVLVISLMFVGVVAYKLFPLVHGVQYASDRASGMPIEEILSERIGGLGDFVQEVLLSYDDRYGHLNIVGNILAILGVAYGISRRKPRIGFIWISYLFYFCIITGILVPLMIYVPGFTKIRLIGRFGIMNIILAGLLAGFGYKYCHDKFEWTRKTGLAFTILLILGIGIVVNLGFLTSVADLKEPKSTIYGAEWAKLLSNDPDHFRIHINEVMGTDNHHINLELFWFDLESTYGIFGTQWDSRYFHEYMSGANFAPNRILGLLNVKYIISSALVPNGTGLSLFKSFNVSSKISGESYKKGNQGYVYYNPEYVHRGFYTNESMAVIGAADKVAELIYGGVLASGEFKTRKHVATALIGNSLKSIPFSQLIQFNALFVHPEGVQDEQDYAVLKRYSDQGGKVFPNIFQQQFEVSFQDIDAYLKSRSTEYIPVNITTYYDTDPNTLVMQIPNRKGFIFLSEKMSLYDGWRASSNGEAMEILPANGIFAVVPVDGKISELRFDFEPRSARTGRILSVITFGILVILGIFCVCKRDDRMFKFLQGSRKE